MLFAHDVFVGSARTLRHHRTLGGGGAAFFSRCKVIRIIQRVNEFPPQEASSTFRGIDSLVRKCVTLSHRPSAGYYPLFFQAYTTIHTGPLLQPSPPSPHSRFVRRCRDHDVPVDDASGAGVDTACAARVECLLLPSFGRGLGRDAVRRGFFLPPHAEIRSVLRGEYVCPVDLAVMGRILGPLVQYAEKPFIASCA